MMIQRMTMVLRDGSPVRVERKGKDTTYEGKGLWCFRTTDPALIEQVKQLQAPGETFGDAFARIIECHRRREHGGENEPGADWLDFSKWENHKRDADGWKRDTEQGEG